MGELPAGPRTPTGAAHFRTRGQPAAVQAIDAMLGGALPHALLLVGPAGVGKTTLALDIAAALLCLAPDPGDRPCRVCRACRALEHGNHPDLHRLAPTGAGAVIPIGGRDERGVRDLTRELSLLPIEGGARVAIVEAAHRMTEDAQAAFLKTLEEPPAGSTLILCADDEERLLPTIRSRCVRLRLGPTGARAIEEVLAEHGLADATLAARLARVSGGRPGLAIGLARAPEALRLRAEISRTLLDLLSGSRRARLAGVRDLAARASELRRAIEAGIRSVDVAPASLGGPGPRAGEGITETSTERSSDESDELATPMRVPAAERRAGALALVSIWREVARDLALVGLGDGGRIRDLDLLEELEVAAALMPADRVAIHLRRLESAGEQLEGNVSPELVLDVLGLVWAA